MTKRNIVLGLGLGLVFGIGFSLWIGFLWWIGDGEPLGRYGFGLIEGVAGYCGGGLIGGLLVGLLFPLRKSAWGSVALGIALFVPVAIGITVVAVPHGMIWSASGIPGASLAAATIGGLLGLQVWSEESDASDGL